MKRRLHLKAGEWIEVLSEQEILRTLDARGQTDGMPFMPQMLQYCGERFRVSKRAHKLCDTVNATGGRSLENAVHLESLRCDGQSYGGCEMGCLLYWREDWLKRVEPAMESESQSHASGAAVNTPQCTRADIFKSTLAPEPPPGIQGPCYVCQATQLPLITRRLPIWKPGQYLEDLRSGNVRLRQVLGSLFFQMYYRLAESGLGFGSVLRGGYNLLQRLRGGSPYPFLSGRLPRGSKTPSVRLRLEPGELVRVKEHERILETVDEDLVNRGMAFHGEMVPYCGKTFRVLKRVRKIMNEKTGQLMELKNECLVLEGADCYGKYTKPLFCPRACYPYWREIWLERVPEEVKPPSALETAASEMNPS